jgi:hypothetical protein
MDKVRLIPNFQFSFFFSVPKSKSLSRPKMRRMGEDEKPLVYAIMWGAKNQTSQKKFVLQVKHKRIVKKD